MKRNHSLLESPRRRLLPRGHRGRARLSFENLETRLALAVNVEDFSNDFDSTIAGYDSWDTDPLTVPGGDTDADPATTLGPDELLIPHDIGPRSRFDFNRHGNATHYLAIVGGLSPESYVIDFAGGRGQPGGLASDAEVVTVGFRYNGGGRVEVVGDHGLKTLDLSNFASWVGLAVTSNDPADTGGEVGAIQRVRFTAGGDLLNVDDISVLVFDAGFSNNPPVAFDDSLVVRAGAPYDIDVLFNDADLDQDQLAITGISSLAAHGTAVVQGDVVHYTPTPGYVGPDSFSYTISDGRGGTDAGTVSISVEAPVAIDDFAATRPGVPIDIEVLENEIEPGGFYPLFIAAASNPDGGTVVIHDGLITYSPDDGFHGADHFTYTVADQFGNSSSADVTVIVNAPPTAPARYFAFPHHFAGTFSLPSPSLYDGGNYDPSDDVFDPDGDVVQVSGEIVQTNYGTVTIVSDGSLTYEPATPDNLVLPVTIPYHVRDAFGALAAGEIHVVATNFEPWTEDAFHYADHGTPTPVRIALTYHDADQDSVKFEVVDSPTYGTVTLLQPEVDATTGDTYLLVQYESVFHSLITSDRFTYRVADRYAQSNISSVTIDVLNQTPIAKTDRYSISGLRYDSTPAGWYPGPEPLHPYYDSRGSVLDNDFDFDTGDTQRLEAVPDSGPTYGRLEYLRPDGTFRYIPPTGPINPGFTYPVGRDSFTYWVTDGVNSARAQVIIAIKDNFGPATNADSYETLEDTTLTVLGSGVRGNDHIDPDHDSIRAVLVEQPHHGTIELSETGAFIYDPDPGFLGVDFFGYDLTDDFIPMVSPGGSPDPIQPFPTWVTIIVHTGDDADGDGITNRTEDLSPLVHPLFSNRDLAYSHQADIVALPAGAGSITLMAYLPSDSDGAFTDVTLASIAPVGVPQPPSDYDFPFGFLSFKFHLPPGDQYQTFRIYVPLELGDDITYLKYGPEPWPDSDVPNWYQPDELKNEVQEFLYQGTEYRLRYLEFQITDGYRGDNDLLANGEIVDPGVIAVVHRPPAATGDYYTADEDKTLNVGGPSGLLANDSSPHGDPLTAVLVSEPVHGTLALRIDGSFDYTPARDFNGTDTFAYMANDGRLDSQIAAVTVTVNPVDDEPPRIDSVVINDGSAQRSKINRITVTFDSAVTLGAGAFELIHQSGRRIALAVALSQVDGRTVAILTFSGRGIIGGSLFDGNYTLVVHGEKIHNQTGAPLDGDNDGIGGGDRRAEFFRRFGDGDGDGDVDRFDRQKFMTSFLRRQGQSGYLWYFDYEGDDRVGVIDLLAFGIASLSKC